jgi:hypothetical protein
MSLLNSPRRSSHNPASSEPGFGRAPAGFSRVEIVPIEHDMWRFYRLWE